MVSKVFLVCLLGVSLSGSVLEEPTPLGDTDGPWALMGLTGYSGLVTMNALTGSSLFYWLFQATDGNITSDTAPLIIWLQGGPGCSGSLGMLWENISPITILPNAMPVRTNTSWTWAETYHVMSIDFPYGAGYSFSNQAGDERNSTEAATYYLYRLLAKLGAKYPTWFQREVYIFGESYGGHWVPGLAYNILQQNAINPGFNIQLMGIGIGDPWVDVNTQSQTYASYGVSTSLINNNEASIISYYQNQVLQQLQAGNVLQAEANWETTYETLQSFSGGVNEYNIRVYGEYNTNYLSTWLNQASTKATLNVPANRNWISCNDTTYDYYKPDIMNSSAVFMPYILAQGVKIMIYNAQDDLIVNSPGVENMMAKINWPGASGFASAPRVNWMVAQNMAGYAQTYNNLTFVLVLAAGHMAPHDQPVNSLDMVNRFIKGTPWSS